MTKLCYTNKDSFIIHVKSGNVHFDLTRDVETRFDTPNHEFLKQKSNQTNAG